LLRDQTTTKKNQDPKDIHRSNIGTKKHTKEEQKIEADKDTNHSGVSDNLHQNKNPPSISEV